jgi:quercetin dioxygenase-like cupin family protein
MARMHVTPSDLRTLRQDGTLVRFALLDAMAFVIAELPPGGSAGTALETACTRPHWGFVVDGEVEVEVGGRRQAVLPGSAFHLPPGGEPHRFFASGAARIAGFEPVDPGAEVTDASLRASGFEVIAAQSPAAATIVPAAIQPLAEPNRIETRTWEMSRFMLTQARFGPGSGYTSEWCDAPHWGLVTAGRIAIEWEDDLEIVAAGDIYHCAGGPPGHRLEAADPATILDLTPVDRQGGRLAAWRRGAVASPLATNGEEPVAIAGLG